ncbi:unnamed protein product [Ambrosiozyma monospora]|uniref:Unnamed protein product n=1 Tax=Ambrosiozyma monospora TaxID=43982 RepID=A0A9W6Z824_AMBMO|nr:unnamed protein product [Ambrosiozyma monospora]
MSQKYEKLTDARFKRFFGADFRSNSDSQWCDLFKPTSYKQILQSSDIRNGLNHWIQDAFTRLSKVDASKRIEKLKKRKPKKASEMDSFIVDEFEEIDDEEAEGVFVPSLIIQGPSGCGKTSAVYAVMKEQLHGIVFEINSSQSRAKKDICFHLKQIGTTKVVNKDENGLILLDDVELIDEEMDKDFWVGITELLTYSYRPVVMITTDLSSIPANIVEESTVIYFDKVKTSITTKYLDLVASSMGFGVPHKILKNLAQLDLRQSLLQLQMFCYLFDKHENGITEITIDKRSEKHEENDSNLKQLLDKEYQQECLIFEPDVEPEDNDSDDLPLDTDLISRNHISEMIEFCSSRYFNNGSRNRVLRYSNGDDYLETHPGCCFKRLSISTLCTEVNPVIREMARTERAKIEMIKEDDERGYYNIPKPKRWFESDPSLILSGSFI